MTMPSSASGPARVAIVDDSASMRRWLRHLLEDDDRLVVAAEAADAAEARAMLRQHEIDVITLDVDMPGMSGIEFLSRLMARRPVPVVMLSALTERGRREAVEALSLGAVDCIVKPRSPLTPDLARDIRDRVWQASRTKVVAGCVRSADPAVARTHDAGKPWVGPVILLGASTGGVAALETLLREIEDVAWPVVIVQHMPEKFLRSFCRRLDALFSRRFLMARDGHVLRSNEAVLALGKDVATHLVRSTGGRITCRLREPSPGSFYRPSVNDLFRSAAETGLAGVAAVLTGMGGDGAEGLLALRRQGFATLAQSEQSCVVFGMPRAAAAIGAVEHLLDPAEIGRFIARRARTAGSAETWELA